MLGIVEATTLNYNYNDPHLLAAYGEHTPPDAVCMQSSMKPGTQGERSLGFCCCCCCFSKVFYESQF